MGARKLSPLYVALAISFGIREVVSQLLIDNDDDDDDKSEAVDCDIYGNCVGYSRRWLLWSLLSTGLFLLFCFALCWWCCRRRKKVVTTTVVVQSTHQPPPPAPMPVQQPGHQTVIINTTQAAPTSGVPAYVSKGDGGDIEKGDRSPAPAYSEQAETIRTKGAKTSRRGGPGSIWSRSEANASMR